MIIHFLVQYTAALGILNHWAGTPFDQRSASLLLLNVNPTEMFRSQSNLRSDEFIELLQSGERYAGSLPDTGGPPELPLRREDITRSRNFVMSWVLSICAVNALHSVQVRFLWWAWWDSTRTYTSNITQEAAAVALAITISAPHLQHLATAIALSGMTYAVILQTMRS